MPIQQNRLTLYPLVLVALLLSACAVSPTGSRSSPSGSTSATPSTSTPAPAAAPVSLAGTSWTAIAINGVPEVVAPKPKLSWTSTDRVAGTGGCNRYAGRATVGLDDLRIGPLDSMGRACLSMPGSQEDMFFKALESTQKARLERDQLVLLDGAGKQMARFVKAN